MWFHFISQTEQLPLKHYMLLVCPLFIVVYNLTIEYHLLWPHKIQMQAIPGLLTLLHTVQMTDTPLENQDLYFLRSKTLWPICWKKKITDEVDHGKNTVIILSYHQKQFFHCLNGNTEEGLDYCTWDTDIATERIPSFHCVRIRGKRHTKAIFAWSWLGDNL